MAKYHVSPDLISHLQISLRKEAGLGVSSVNPSDHLPPSPPNLQDAIAAVGSNADDAPRCEGCNAELLLGFDSTICVFCGRFPTNFHGGTSPDPISFVSTFGYRLFLSSLSLDGSESVERPIEGANELGRVRNSVVNEIPLSAFLDLQLKWPNESNRLGLEKEVGKQSRTLVGVNFDEIFEKEGSSEVASHSLKEKEAASKKVELKENTTFAGQSSLSLFEKTQTGSVEGENDESDWAVDFQSANADVTVDPGFQMASRDWPLKQANSANTAVFEAFSTSGTESNFEQPSDSKLSERDISVKDGQKGLETVDSFDWLPAATSISDKGEPPHNDKLVGGNSISWDEFGMFSGAENNRGEHVSATFPQSESGGEFNIDDSWNDFAGSTGPGHKQLENNLEVDKPVYGAGDEFGLFGHGGLQQLDVHVESMPSMTSDQGKSLGLSSNKEVGVSFDLFNGFKSSGIGDDSLDVWSDFAQTTGVANSQPINNDASTRALSGFSSIMINRADPPQNSETKTTENQTSMEDNDVWSDFAQSTSVVNRKPIDNDVSSQAMGDFSSLISNLADRPLIIGETKSAENQTSMENNDAFGSWSDLGSSWKQPDTSFSDLNLNGSTQDRISTGRNVDSLSPVEDKSSQNSWSNVGLSTSFSEQPSHTVEMEPSESKLTYEDSDLFLGLNGKSTSVNDEEIDVWTDFTSSSNRLADKSGNTNVQTSIIQEPIIRDPFGEWNVISGASNSESDRVIAADSIPQINMLSTNVDSHFASNSFIHEDPFLRMSTDQNGFPEIASSQTEVPNLVGTEHQDAKASDLSNTSGTAFKEGNDQKSPDVENLISEMHDLSFMLESSLSVPKPGT